MGGLVGGLGTYVAGVVDHLVLHFHLGILEPDRRVAVVHVQTPFIDTPRPLELVLGLFPGRILHVGA